MANSVPVTKEVLSMSNFVLQGIQILSKDSCPANGLHVVDSGLNGAIHLYSDGERHPAESIQELMRDGVILAKLAKGGVTIYDARHIEDFDRKKCFCDTSIVIKQIEKRKMLKEIKLAFMKVFNWTEAARLCNGQMTFVQGIKKKGSPAKKGVKYQSVHNGRIKFTMQHSGNETCYEYYLGVPTGVSLTALIAAVQHAVINSQTKWGTYVIKDEQTEEFAQKVLEKIVPGHGSSEKEEKQGVFGLNPGKVETDDEPVKVTVDLCETSIKLILLAVQKKYGIDKEILRPEFTKILTEELGLDNPSKQVLSGIVKRLSNSHHRIINLVRGTSGAKWVKGYLLTPQAKKILGELEKKKGSVKKAKSVDVSKTSAPNVVDQGNAIVSDEIEAIAVLRQQETSLVTKLQEVIVKQEVLTAKEAEIAQQLRELIAEQKDVAKHVKELATKNGGDEEALGRIRQEIQKKKEKLIELL